MGMTMRKKLFSLVAALTLGVSAEGPKIIFDSDMYTDFDDVGALAVLHALADAGECEILGTVVSAHGPASVGMVECINAFYGRGDLPVGAPKGLGRGPHNDSDAEKSGPYNHYIRIVKADPSIRHPLVSQAPDANETYRKILAAQPDGSVTIVTTGFTTNLRRLLETKGDAVSPLDGRALVAKKVKEWYAMACKYPDGFEYNSGMDGGSSQIVLRDWPTPAYFCDFNYGVDVYSGVAVAARTEAVNPVRDVFKRALPEYGEVGRGHPSWDEVTVLAAVRGWQKYFGVVRGHFEIVNGVDNHWTADPNGSHYVLTVKTPKAEVGRILDELMSRPPKQARKEEPREERSDRRKE